MTKREQEDDMDEPRTDLVAHIREQIAAGAYETRGKLEIVTERVAEEFRG